MPARVTDEDMRRDILDGVIEPPEKEIILKAQKISDVKRFILTTKGVYFERWVPPLKDDKGNITREGFWGNREMTYAGFFHPIEKLVIDGMTLFRIRTDKEVIMSMKNVVNHLKTEGGVVNRGKIDDSINAVSLDLPVREGHATYGVYLDECGLMKVCFDIMPYKSEQIKINRRAQPAVDMTISKEKIEPYVEATKHRHLYEILPAMGMSVIAPFGLIFRQRQKLVVILWHFAPVSHLGKTTVFTIYSNLFSIFPISGNTINSEFRILSVIDSVGALIPINEVDNVNWNALDDVVKSFPESYIAGGRGKADLSMEEYLSRGVLGVTSNRFRIKNKNSLNRIFKIPFDVRMEGARNKIENTIIIDELVAKTEPIGWRLVEYEIDYVNGSLDALISVINGHVNELRKYYKRFADPRRPFSWGMCYEGLKVWERACEKFNIDWKAPSYEEFANAVIDKIETAAKKSGTVPIADFVHWWEMWKARNKKNMKMESDNEKPIWVDVITGKDEIWAEKTLKYGGKKHKGDVITDAVLREYQRDKDHAIDSLTEIGEAVASIMGIPKDEIIKRWNIGGGTCWAVFIPHTIFRYGVVKDEWEESCTDDLNDEDWMI